MRTFAAADPSKYLKIGRRNVLWRPWIVNGMVVASFFIYALAALIVCSDQRNDFIPERSSIAAAVSNGIWWDYAIKHNIPRDAAVQMTYGQAYDTALREAFFNVARLYPGDTFKAFLYYKPPSIFRSIKESSDLRLADAPPALLWLLIASLGNFFAFALIAAQILKSSDMMTIAGSTVLLAVFSAIPYLAVWAMPHTSGDLLFYCFFGLRLGGGRSH